MRDPKRLDSANQCPGSADLPRNALDAVRLRTYHNFCFPNIFEDEILTDATPVLAGSLVRNCCEFEPKFSSQEK